MVCGTLVGMGFFGALSALLDENSEDSFENKLNRALDRVEVAVQGGLEKAESGIKKIDNAAERATKAIDTVDEVSKTAEAQLKHSEE